MNQLFGFSQTLETLLLLIPEPVICFFLFLNSRIRASKIPEAVI
jgi:hypothetical protein